MSYGFDLITASRPDLENLASILAAGLSAEAEWNGEAVAFHLMNAYVHLNPVREDHPDYRGDKKRPFQIGILVLDRAFAPTIIELLPADMDCRVWFGERPHSYSIKGARDHFSGRLYLS